VPPSIISKDLQWAAELDAAWTRVLDAVTEQYGAREAMLVIEALQSARIFEAYRDYAKIAERKDI
jgi:hypothetical protein